jgi:hypothetical protein
VVKYFTDLMQLAGWTAAPETTCTTSSYDCPIFIKQKLAEKRSLRKPRVRQKGKETYKLELTNKKYKYYTLLESDKQVVGPVST